MVIREFKVTLLEGTMYLDDELLTSIKIKEAGESTQQYGTYWKSGDPENVVRKHIADIVLMAINKETDDQLLQQTI